jgi:hypothetical protein
MIAGVAAIFVAVFPMWYDKMYPVAIESAPVLPLAPDCKCPAAASSFRYEDMFRLFSKIHYYSACVLFGCMALVAWFCSKTTLKNKTLSAGLDKKPPTWADLNPKCSSFVIAWLPVLAIPFLWLRDKLPTQRDTFRRNYNWIGLAMALFPVAVWAVASWTQQNKYLVLIVEAIGVWTFAAFWLLKSHELMLSRPEEKAIKGNPLVPLFLLPSDDARVGPDYTVRWREPDGRELSVGRIFRASAGVPEATPWFWSVDFDQRPGRAEPHEGHAATEEDARASWKRCWESADVPIRWPPFDVATGPNSRPQSVQPTSQFEAGRRDP